MDAEELLKGYAAGERDFAGITLSDIRLGGGGGVNLEGVNFSGAIFKNILIERYRTTNITIGSKFTNCNFSYSKWSFCEMPRLVGCNLQYSVMEGCFFSRRFIDCDWRYGQLIGADFDEFILERCDLRERLLSIGPFLGFEDRGGGLQYWGYEYVNTIDPDGVFHSGIYCSLPRPTSDEIPF
jgi:uncharacterized protein YjbI with pentapeptide repeats